jgi:hypothetical protein
MDTRPSRRIGVAVGAALIISTMLSGPAFGQATATPGTGTPAATGSPAATTTALATTSPTAVPTTTPVVVTATPTAQPAATPTPAPAPAISHDERYFTQTGFRIDNDVVWDYFLRRGAVNTFGYPVSRTFQFRGVQAQFFQRRIVEIGPDGKARQANLLDPELMPYTKINGATFPAPDPAVQGAAPSATDAPATLAFVQRTAPDQFNGRPVNFLQTFSTMVPFQVAFPSGGSPDLLPGVELEMWGVPTSNPAADPNNGNFVYQRWQRGIMHYRAECNCTEAILLADYLKAIITGQNLPADLDAQAQSSPFYKQYDPTKPQWIRDPAKLSGTDLTNAFTPG